MRGAAFCFFSVFCLSETRVCMYVRVWGCGCLPLPAPWLVLYRNRTPSPPSLFRLFQRRCSIECVDNYNANPKKKKKKKDRKGEKRKEKKTKKEKGTKGKGESWGAAMDKNPTHYA
ncbi:hypothetical protein IWX49DRAFT_585434 [Phyllosticta citricarpa]